MKNGDYYNLIYTTPEKKTGLDVNYSILVKDNQKTVYLLFPGSGSIWDWIIDITFSTTTIVHNKNIFVVHTGVATAWNSAKNKIIEEVISIRKKYSNYAFKICGHSLGGGYAICAAEEFFYRTGEKPEVITMGCPRIIENKKSVDYLLSCMSIKQFAYKNDMVPKLPAFYKHLNLIEIGDPYNFWEMTKNAKYWHCKYGEME